MASLITENLKLALVEQLGMELENSNFYMRVSAFLKSKGLENLGDYFYEQVKEEREHVDILYKLLTDLNQDFLIPSISGIEMNYESFSEVAEEYLRREESTTSSLKEIMDMSAEDESSGGGVVKSTMLSMLSMQQHELAESSTMLDKANLLKEWYQVVLYDASLGG